MKNKKSLKGGNSKMKNKDECVCCSESRFECEPCDCDDAGKDLDEIEE